MKYINIDPVNNGSNTICYEVCREIPIAHQILMNNTSIFIFDIALPGDQIYSKWTGIYLMRNLNKSVLNNVFYYKGDYIKQNQILFSAFNENKNLISIQFPEKSIIKTDKIFREWQYIL